MTCLLLLCSAHIRPSDCSETFNRHILLSRHFIVAHDRTVDLSGITLNRPNVIVRRTVQPSPIRFPTQVDNGVTAEEMQAYELCSRKVKPIDRDHHAHIPSSALSSAQIKSEDLDYSVHIISDFTRQPISLYEEIGDTIIRTSERNSKPSVSRPPLHLNLNYRAHKGRLRTGFSGFAERVLANESLREK